MGLGFYLHRSCMCCFAFSTIIGWGLYGSRCIEFLGGEKLVRPFLVAYSFVSIIGATINLGLLWDIADTFNGLMAIPNLIALLVLSGRSRSLQSMSIRHKRAARCKTTARAYNRM